MKVFVINKKIRHLAQILPFFHNSYVILSDKWQPNSLFEINFKKVQDINVA